MDKIKYGIRQMVFPMDPPTVGLDRQAEPISDKSTQTLPKWNENKSRAKRDREVRNLSAIPIPLL